MTDPLKLNKACDYIKSLQVLSIQTSNKTDIKLRENRPRAVKLRSSLILTG